MTLNLQNYRPINQLFIDSSVQRVGYSVFDPELKKLLTCGLINTSQIPGIKQDDKKKGDKPVNETLGIIIRSRYIVSILLQLISEHKVNKIVIECPNPAIYNLTGAQGGAAARIQRTTAIFKLIAACYYCIAAITAANVQCLPISPGDWQPSKKQRLGLDSKPWSLWHANTYISAVKYNHRNLRTKDDENIADAINLGYFFVVAGMRHEQWLHNFMKPAGLVV